LVSVKNCSWRVRESGLFHGLELQGLAWAMTESAEAEEEAPECRAWSPWLGLFAGPFSSCSETGYCGNLTCGCGRGILDKT